MSREATVVYISEYKGRLCLWSLMSARGLIARGWRREQRSLKGFFGQSTAVV